MSDVLKHRFISPKLDGADTQQVQPSHWNDGHRFQGGAEANLLIRDTADPTFGAVWIPGNPFVPVVTTGSVNDWAPQGAGVPIRNAMTIVSYGAGTLTITGIAGGVPGALVTVKNMETSSLALTHADPNSLAINRLYHFTTATVSLGPGGWATYYRTTDSWILVAHEHGSPIGYGPTWATTGTPPVIGGGSLTAQYVRRGTWVEVDMKLAFGSGTTAGTGAFTLSLPFAAAPAAQSYRVAGFGLANDNDQGDYGVIFQIFSPTTIVGYHTTDRSNGIGGTVPFTWTTGDSLTARLRYQVS